MILELDKMLLFCIVCLKRFKWIHTYEQFLVEKVWKSVTDVRKGKQREGVFLVNDKNVLQYVILFLPIKTTIPRINSETNLPHAWTMLFTSIWNSFLAQSSGLLVFQYAATLSSGKGPDLFLQSRPFQNLRKSFQKFTLPQ